MSDTKWADVAHYYTKSQIDLQIKNRDHAERFLMVSFRNVGGSHFEEWVNDGVYWRAYGSQFSAWADHKPILRHRDDMTEAQVLECIKCGWPVVAGKPIKEFACIPDHSEFGSAFTYKIVFDGSPHYMAGTMSFRSLDSNQFVWLISRGFDVFGLIESGQAIRKEMGNGNS